MKPAQLVTAITALYDLRRPGFIWGPPGIGKSDLVAQAAQTIAQRLVKDKKIKKTSDFGLVDFRMALRDPTDIKGFPMPDGGTQTMKFYRDAELPTSGCGILFMDELNSAMPATQAAGMQLTLKDAHGKHRIGDYELPEGWSIIAAGNRETDRGVVHRMPTPLANRFTHLDAEVDAMGWCNWAIDHDVSPELIAFIRLKEDLLFKFDPKIDAKAFPTPRSWMATEDIVKGEIPSDVQYEMIKGTVGEGPGSEYWAFRRLVTQLPTLEQIVTDPKGTPVPPADQLSARCAIATMLGANAKDSNVEQFLTYMERMNKELQAVFARDALRKDPKIKTNKVYGRWALANAELF